MEKLKIIKKLLVGNRGEIAIRIFRAASELKIRTVAIYTYEDRYSLHRYKADEAYQVGKNDEPLKPYLDIDAIISLALKTGVDAIHPGYGFLSENDMFAQRCLDAGLIWVGPSPQSMKTLGDKISAKKIALKNDVPIIESSPTALDNEQEVREVAQTIGYPVMIKAAVGGGGRGMRVVRSDKDLSKGYLEASREALTAFGNSMVFVEKFVDNPKHIEVQIMADQYGNTVHLFERDCSVQRRFQKVIEVAPAQNVSQKTTEKLYQYAVSICKSVDYINAGTVEFLIDLEENIFFIEVNTRIQVEHTITEVITGIDLVRTQILVAMGYSLGSDKIGLGDQSVINYRGVAIQCRITTEDPQQGFKPDYGRIVAYRSASGFGIRLDAGHAYDGAIITPFFDSLLVKVTGHGRTISDAAERLHRALREFRVRGVKTNISFLLNLLSDEKFRSGNVTVNYIAEHPELMAAPKWKDRGTKLLHYLAETIVNGNSDIKQIDHSKVFLSPPIPPMKHLEYRPGLKQLLSEKGPGGVVNYVKDEKKILYTDTTFRDAHQSLLATRIRSHDMLQVAERYSQSVGHQLFSMEVWGGATFDVSMRFLKESPWKRLKDLREACPNVLLQMLLRGSNAVGYKAYPDNVIEEFIVQTWKSGIDVFRIFDSLNWVEAMKVSIRTVLEKTEAIAEASICYTGDVLKQGDNRFNLDYYISLAMELEDTGAHMLAIKDMAGLLKPDAAAYLITELKKVVDMPIHLHTHDTSSIQSTTYLSAINAEVDIIDVALSSLSGITSQPNFNSLISMLEYHDRASEISTQDLNPFSNYWEVVRSYYYPFETELKAGTSEVYEHEIPGGQYSNLRPQARGLGLEDQFETIKKNYKAVNDMLGGIVKVTPSSKVIGDMAMFMTSNHFTIEDIMEKGNELSFPDSMVSLMKGDLGQWKFGWPEKFQRMVLKGEKPYSERPNEFLKSLDLDKEYVEFQTKYDEHDGYEDFLSYLLYPKVYEEYYEHMQRFGRVSNLPTLPFFYGLKPNEEISVTIDRGKTIHIEFLNMNEPDEYGNRLVIFRLNGSIRSVFVKDRSLKSVLTANEKVSDENQLGSPLQGSLSKLLVKTGETVEKNQPVFIIEAMKMETTVSAHKGGIIKIVHLKEKTLVEQDDLIMTIE